MLDFLVGNDFLSAIIAFAVVLIPAVIIHELGHFLAAKAVGITVLEFGVGFPPRVAKLFSWGETEFTLNLLPLGGFVRPLGEDFVRPLSEQETERERQKFIESKNKADVPSDTEKRESSDEKQYVSEREELAARGIHKTMSVNEAKPMGRILFMAAGALANFISAFLIFMIVAMIGIPEIVGGRIGITQVSEDSLFAEAGLQNGDIIERINGEYFSNDVDFFDQIQTQNNEPITLTIYRPAENLTYESEPFVLDAANAERISNIAEGVMVVAVSADTPAENVLLAGDIVIAANGISLKDVDDPIAQLQQYSVDFAGEDLILTLLRNNQEMDVTIIPQEDPPPGVGRIGVSIRSGFVSGGDELVYIETSPQVTSVPQSVSNSFEYGVDRTVMIFELIAEFPARLLQGATEPEERRVVSIVGVSQLGGAFLQDSIEEDQPIVFLEYIALISIALGFTNLLPLPALDGGRILFVIIEMIRGEPISPEREGVIHFVGLIFLLSVGVIFIFNDLINPVTNLLP
ncbi:MAG: RIP metalloprotease RseP [Aggregatilineales bacterium]